MESCTHQSSAITSKVVKLSNCIMSRGLLPASPTSDILYIRRSEYFLNRCSCLFKARSEKAGENRRRTRACSLCSAVRILRTPAVCQEDQSQNATNGASRFRRTIYRLNREFLRFLLHLWAMDVLPRLSRCVTKIGRTEPDHRPVLVVQLLHPSNVLATYGDKPIRDAAESTYFRAWNIGEGVQSHKVDCSGDIIHQG